jgi:nitroimidazol reductase NimA-like FMN-containing flavoprotein (pyridoxamine 5'-phosphate oxidase superfamily)
MTTLPPDYTPTPRTQVRRSSSRGSYDRSLVHSILDEALVCHVGFVQDAQPFVLPMAFARVDERLYLHGAVANRMLGVMAERAPICVTVTLLDGLVLARSAYHHSMNYRTVVALGTASEVLDEAEKRVAFDALIERVRAGRSREARAANAVELKITRVLALDLGEVSAKARTGPPRDEPEDMTLPCWAGIIPLALTRGTPIDDPAGPHTG